MSNEMVELALLIKGGGKKGKDKDSKQEFEGFVIGTVESELPDLKVRTDPKILLHKENILVAAHVLRDYEREFEIFEGNEIIINGSVPNTFTAKGKIKWTNTLEIGDNVILVSAGDDQNYVLVDKAVRL